MGSSEQPLRLDAEGYRGLVEQASDGIFIASADGVYLDVNESGARMLGMTRDEIIGRSISDVVDVTEVERLTPEYGRVLNGEVSLAEWSMKRKDGSLFAGEVSAKVLSDGRVQGILRDVTARKMAEEALRQNAARSLNLSAAAFDGIGITERGLVVDVNDQLAEMLGYERSELIGKQVMDMVAPESRELVEAAIRSGHDGSYEHLSVRKDGSLLAVEARGRIMDFGGRKARVTVIRDVSQRRRVEDAVRSILEGTSVVGTEFFGALVRGVASALGVRYAFVAELLPGSPERVRSVALSVDGRLCEAIEYDTAGTPCELVLARGLCFYPRDVQRQFPGDTMLVEMGIESYLGVRLLGANGEPLGLLAALHDKPLEHSELAKSVLTIFAGRAAAEIERLRSDAALRRSEESLRATIDTTPHVAIQWYDAAGRVRLWNRASERMFGWTAAEALGHTLDELIQTPEEAREFNALISEIGRTSQPFGPAEQHFRRRDGSEGHCLSTLFRIPDADGNPRFVCMDVDISERRRAEREKAELEAQLRHTQKLEALGALAGGIAHDFNNILAAIFAFGELALLDIDRPHEVREHLAELQTAAGRARDLVRQILAFSRRQVQERSPTPLCHVVQEALSLLRSTLPGNIELEAHVDTQAPPVLATPGQIHQVVVNLCMNAMHAMRGRPGRLRVALERVVCDAALALAVPELRPGVYVRLSVRDTGHGMDAATLARIFEPFFTTKPPGEGTGLGLAVVHGIVRDHEATLNVRSTIARGTTFEVYFPAHEWSVPGIEQALAAHASGRGEQILFVDDEAAICEASRLVLERIGYHVTTHTDARVALDDFRAAARRYQIVITDLTMPSMTGMELARRMLELEPGLPVVVVSGFAGGVTADDVRALGARELLMKPLTPSALAATVRRMLDETVPTASVGR